MSELFPQAADTPDGIIQVIDEFLRRPTQAWIWECQRCKALVKDMVGHELWHAGVDSITVALANRPR